MNRRDYYDILQVFPGSSSDEIKRAYRKLAVRFHPDKNPGNEQSALHFRDIAAAYEVLSDPLTRREYDREQGFDTADAKRPVTPMLILQDASRLRRYVFNINLHSVDQQALLQHFSRILSDPNLQLLKEFNENSINKQVLADLLDSCRFLQYQYLSAVIPRLQTLAGTDQLSQININHYLQFRKRRHLWDMLLPYLVLLLTLVLCFLIYVMST